MTCTITNSMIHTLKTISKTKMLEVMITGSNIMETLRAMLMTWMHLRKRMRSFKLIEYSAIECIRHEVNDSTFCTNFAKRSYK